MHDLDILKELEKQLNIQFTEVNPDDFLQYGNTKNGIYSINDEGSIQKLKIENSELNFLPELINRFPHLEHLELPGNNIQEFSSFTKLTRLKILRLFGNHLSDFSHLSELKALQHLDVSFNKIENMEVFEEIKKLQHLTSLIISSNNITNISYLKEIKKLTFLSIGNNKVVDISPLKDLKQLEYLILSKNEIKDISILSELNSLELLDLNENSISDVSALQGLKSLITLDLAGNPIKNLPKWITSFNMDIKWLEKRESGSINFFDNPIENPPVEIIKQGKEAIQAWFLSDRKRLNEIKILLVGEAKAGKTSVCRKLKYDIYDAEQQQTDGIVIETFAFSKLDTFDNHPQLYDTTAYCWDFGGQEIMSSTHQFFMTKRSIYILVLEARRDAESDKQIRKWLERIQTFGGNSPVIVLGNKIDLNPSFGVDTTTLQKDFPQIKGFINISCYSGENIEKLKALLCEFIPQAELFDTEIDERWISLKNALQKNTASEYKLSHKEFVEICVKNNLTESENQTQAIRFLNDLGIVLHFDELNLSEYYVLDPLWVTSGVYRIITSETTAKQKGEVEIADLPRIINDEIKESQKSRDKVNEIILYSPNECRFLADIMVQFKLGYYTDNHTKILMPDMLNKETPKIESERFYNASEKLSLIYSYKYMPSAVIPRIMVELKRDLKQAWRTGAILCSEGDINADAMVTAVENRIDIIVLGEYKQKRDYISIIRYVIDQINSTYNVEVNMFIPLPNNPDILIEYEELIGYEIMGIEQYPVGKLRKTFSVKELLDGIISKDELAKTIDPSLKSMPAALKKIKIFLASSFELKQDREQFEILVNRENKKWIDKGYFIELLIWEDFLDAMSASRLQDEYNRAIKDCDIFVMLFATKVGIYTEEEFEVAFSQFTKTSKPLVYTYFKNTNISTGDINEEILSLLKFKKKLKDLGHFFTEYKNIDELKYKFNEQLDKIYS